jgi:hypothetical protein
MVIISKIFDHTDIWMGKLHRRLGFALEALDVVSTFCVLVSEDF